MLDTWIYATPAAWAALDSGDDGEWQVDRYTYQNAITGFWKDFNTNYRVYNIITSEEDLAAFQAVLGANAARIFCWIQGDGSDSLDVNQTIPADVLAVMRDHVEYDEDGQVVSTTPASYDNPNWGHVFFGQATRIFAGAFSSGFSRGFK
jgi:hypothetical protein